MSDITFPVDESKNAPPDINERIGLLEQQGKQGATELIELLGHPKTSVRKMARSALTAISGQDFGLNSKAWEAWYKRPRSNR